MRREFVKNLSDSDLVMSLKKLVDKERKLLYVILEHIREVNARQLHLARGFKSLKEYMIEEFGYSGSAADRRISAALLLEQVPTVASRVQDGSLNLTQIVNLSVAIKDKERIDGVKLSPQNKLDLVESVAGLNGRDTQYEIAHTLNLPIKQFERSQVQADESYRVELTLTKQ